MFEQGYFHLQQPKNIALEHGHLLQAYTPFCSKNMAELSHVYFPG